MDREKRIERWLVHYPRLAGRAQAVDLLLAERGLRRHVLQLVDAYRSVARDLALNAWGLSVLATYTKARRDALFETYEPRYAKTEHGAGWCQVLSFLRETRDDVLEQHFAAGPLRKRA